MGDYVTLLGVDGVKAAGYAMASAAESMQRTQSFHAEELQRHRRFMDEWLTRLERVLKADRSRRVR